MVGITAPVSYVCCMKIAAQTARIALVTLCLGLTPALADQHPQGWIPQEITLPADMDIVIDRKIGSANRMLSFTTEEDADSLADIWREALEQGPYQVQSVAEGMDGRMIAFSGGRVQNGQITFLRGADSTSTTVQFDASIND